jgi:hypothetical protein
VRVVSLTATAFGGQNPFSPQRSVRLKSVETRKRTRFAITGVARIDRWSRATSLGLTSPSFRFPRAFFLGRCSSM